MNARDVKAFARAIERKPENVLRSHDGPELDGVLAHLRRRPRGPKTLDKQQLKRQVASEAEKLETLADLVEHHQTPRPRCRADCEKAVRPCPWVGCKWNLYLDANDTGSIRFNLPELEPDEMADSCALDLAELGGMTLEQIAQRFNVTREFIRQLEAKAFAKLVEAGLEQLETPHADLVYPPAP